MGDHYFSGFDNVGSPCSNFVTQEHEGSSRLAAVEGSSFVLRADYDYTEVLTPGEKGRDAFRIMSNNKYDTHVSV